MFFFLFLFFFFSIFVIFPKNAVVEITARGGREKNVIGMTLFRAVTNDLTKSSNHQITKSFEDFWWNSSKLVKNFFWPNVFDELVNFSTSLTKIWRKWEKFTTSSKIFGQKNIFWSKEKIRPIFLTSCRLLTKHLTILSPL